MFECLTYVTIEQQPTESYPNRRRTFVFDFITEFECSDSCEDMTNTCTLTFPKNVYVRDENGRLFSFGGENKNIGGFTGEPLFLKGDTVRLEAGYRYYDKIGNEVNNINTLFQGYISEVDARTPVVLKCEDNMWKLKQLPCVNKLWKGTQYTLESVLSELLRGTEYSVNAITSTNIGDIRTENETVAQFIARMKDEYRIVAYFRGFELRIGVLKYIENEAVTRKFKFQYNIVSDDLTYKRVDDIVLSAVAYSINEKELTETTKDGKKKTKKERLECLVYAENGAFKYKEKPYPANKEGERRTLYFYGVNSVKELAAKAEQELKKYYYQGLRGKFTTFIVPYVRMGDNAELIDEVLPERNGVYKIKSVRYTGGMGGHRQEIELDYKI